VESFVGEHPEMMKRPELPDYPYVIKAAIGGEGQSVWLVRDAARRDQILSLLKQRELAGSPGFVVQEYLPDLTRDLRVVVIGNKIVSYWRNGKKFLNNLAQGGEIDFDSDLDLQGIGKEAVRRLSNKTGINLAGFDLIFPNEAEKPLFLEINYTFGRTGLGGSESFYQMLKQAVEEWRAGI
jgi:ribosomal protein S6--L-glutamate ligase